MDVDGNNQSVLMDGPDYECSPAFSPDGRRLAFRVSRSDSAVIHIRNSGGSTSGPIAVDLPESCGPVWSPDGTWMCFTGVDGRGRIDVHAVPVAGGPGFPRTLHADRNEACEWRPERR